MLSLKNIKKSYKTGAFTQVALNNVSLNFRENEFVAILGQSGSGKTTLLNIIGGLDRYDEGDLIINGKSTKQFKQNDWDAYRNNSIGFVFQSYNLIPHLSVINNVEMGMTLSGVSAKERRAKAKEVLERVGLKDHMHKRPNQLSGGQMQRVAIARALANDPDIILADEPTGALDTKTSIQIMDLIKEIAKDKLVIMVTHNPELANQYADRIIELRDGEILSDSNPLTEDHKVSDYKLKKTSMSFLTALKLSGKNISTKKGRTLLTAFASSIGIIGISLILALSNGFDKKIAEFEAGALSTFPIMVTQSTVQMDEETLREHRSEMMGTKNGEEFPDEKIVYPVESVEEQMTHTNVLTDEYVEYVENIDPSLISGISYTRMLNIQMLHLLDGIAKMVDTSKGFTSYPKSLDSSAPNYLERNYDLLAGSFPESMNDIVLIVDNKNRVDQRILQSFGIETTEEGIQFEDIVGKEYRIILNDDFYKNVGGFFTLNGNPNDLTDLYNNENAIPVKISGILRAKETEKFPLIEAGFVYSDELAEFLIQNASESEIVKTQQDANYNVLTGEVFDPNNPDDLKKKEAILSSLGGSAIPYAISIYPVNFDAKDEVTNYLDEYNDGKDAEDQIIYTDLAKTLTEMSGGILSAITLVLVAFSAISLIVSVIMVGIITYISVLERTKEIGVLRALGARKKDITRVFNAETFIIGLSSGLLGIAIAQALIFPINNFLENMTDLPNVAQLNPVHAILLVVISLVLTVLGGAIPAKWAAKKDPVEALRTE